jgi:hypothetical protein
MSDRLHSYTTSAFLCGDCVDDALTAFKALLFGGFARGLKLRCPPLGAEKGVAGVDSRPLSTEQKVLPEQQTQNHHNTEWSGAGEKLEQIRANFAGAAQVAQAPGRNARRSGDYLGRSHRGSGAREVKLQSPGA